MNKKIILFSALMITATQSILTHCENQTTQIMSQEQDGSLKNSKQVEPAQCHHQVDPMAIIASRLSTTPFGVTKQDLFDQMLSECNYTPDCIKNIRTTFHDELPAINEVLEQEYMRQYRRATTHMTREEQIKTLNNLELCLILSPSAIARGQEGPALKQTDDGSDRGGLGLRMQALLKVKKEIESAQQ